jgi:hypothetical protein
VIRARAALSSPSRANLTEQVLSGSWSDRLRWRGGAMRQGGLVSDQPGIECPQGLPRLVVIALSSGCGILTSHLSSDSAQRQMEWVSRLFDQVYTEAAEELFLLKQRRSGLVAQFTGDAAADSLNK